MYLLVPRDCSLDGGQTGEEPEAQLFTKSKRRSEQESAAMSHRIGVAGRVHPGDVLAVGLTEHQNDASFASHARGRLMDDGAHAGIVSVGMRAQMDRFGAV